MALSKQGKIYIGILTAGLLLVAISEFSKPKTVNWFPSYNAQHKIPFGTYVFNKELPEIVPENFEIKKINNPAYQYLTDGNTINNGTYIFVNNSISFGEDELFKLLDWVDNGNILFVASHSFEDKLLDTLNLKLSYIPSHETTDKTLEVNLTQKGLSTRATGIYDRVNNVNYFEGMRYSDATIAKATIQNDTESYSIGVQKNFGKGSIILTTFPEAFTNYFLLTKNNHEYTSGIASYIQGLTVYVDQYYINGKIIHTSPLYLFLSNKYLKAAYYMLLTALFVFIFFEAKRKQRAIPIVKPLTNQTLEFTRKIGNMYFEQGQHKEIALQSIELFLNKVRQKHHLNTEHISTEFLNILSERTGNSKEQTEELFQKFKQVQNSPKLTKEIVLHLNQLIESYTL